MTRKAVFFDKDGTLVKDVPYNVNPNLIELNRGASECLRLLRENGFLIFVVSNQSGVARGLFAETDLAAVWARINELCGIEFDGFYFCPHLPTGKIARYSFECDCRKPAAGLILLAAGEHSINLKESWFIGDSPKDIEAGRRAGCRTILLTDENRGIDNPPPDFTVKNLLEAAKTILK